MVVYVYALNYAVSETGVAVVLLSFHINSDFFFPAVYVFFFLQVLDNNVMVKIERKFLLEIQSEHGGLLEAVTDLEARLKLISEWARVVH